ncbi:MAG: NrfD/PsrC family molybdoenzyme membrane anchor subunit [Gemmataceae bacterium]
MNLFVADPEWGAWIVLYFYLGGIAAGAYFIAALVQVVGGPDDRELSRAGYFIAFPLIVLCGLFLIIDLHRPERFWHMLFKSEVVKEAFGAGWPFSGRAWSLMWRSPLFKYWSPMSVGSWALTVFGFFAAVSFVGSFWPNKLVGRNFFRPIGGRIFAAIGTLFGFFIAAYTGALLSATNQPIWSDSVWLAPLFLTSAASTGIAAMILMLRRRGVASPASIERLERADLWALGLELVLFVVFLASLGGNLNALAHSGHGIVVLGGTLLLGLLAPLAIHLRLGVSGRRAEIAAASLALLGGFLLRYGIVYTPPELLREGPAAVAGFGPEDGRAQGAPGADPLNRGKSVEPRSKVFHDE